MRIILGRRSAPSRLLGLRLRRGSGAPATLIPVKGKVTYKGKPVTKGTVKFEPDGYGREARGAAPVRRHFRPHHLQGRRRVVAGDHRVIDHRPRQEPRQGSRLQKYSEREHLRA